MLKNEGGPCLQGRLGGQKFLHVTAQFAKFFGLERPLGLIKHAYGMPDKLNLFTQTRAV